MMGVCRLHKWENLSDIFSSCVICSLCLIRRQSATPPQVWGFIVWQSDYGAVCSVGVYKVFVVFIESLFTAVDSLAVADAE